MSRLRKGALVLVTALAAVSAAWVAPVSAADSAGGKAPQSFDVDVKALPFQVEIQAPTALPLVVTGGYAYSGVQLNSQPQLIGTAAPVYAPLANDLGLLGGPGAVPGIAVNIIPGLLVGLGPTVGLPPVPVDPRAVPLPKVPVFPAPPLPPTSCFSYVPGEPSEARCGGPSQNLLGFDVGGATGDTRSAGSGDDPSSLASEAAVRSIGLRPTEGNSLVPVTVGGIASAATSSIVAGRVVAGATAAVTDIDVAGTLNIGSVRTSLSAATGGRSGSAGLTREPCAIEGATVLGVPVRVDGDGVHVADNENATKLFQAGGGQNPFVGASKALSGPFVDNAAKADAAINQVLKTAGLTVKQAGPKGFDPGYASSDSFFGGPPSIAADGTAIQAENACLEVIYQIPVSGTRVRMLFGRAGLSMNAFAESGASSLASAPDSIPPAPDVLGTELSATGGASGPGGTVGLAPPSAPEPSSIAGTPSTRAIRAGVRGRQADLRGVFAAFAMLALGLPVLAALAHLTAYRRRYGGRSHAV